MGSNAGSTGNTTSYSMMSPQLNALLGQATTGVSNEQNALMPQITSLTANNPQQIPQISSSEQSLLNNILGSTNNQGLTGTQQNSISSIYGDTSNAKNIFQQQQGQVADVVNPARENLGSIGGQLGQFSSGPIGSNPLMQAFEQTQLPQIMQQANIGGLGQGAQAEAVSNAAANQAMNIANMQQSALGQEASIAGQNANLGLQGLNNQTALVQDSLNANTQANQAMNNISQTGLSNLGGQLSQAALPRTLEAQQQQANFQEIQNLQNMLQSSVNAPFGALAGAGIGQATTSTGTTAGK